MFDPEILQAVLVGVILGGAIMYPIAWQQGKCDTLRRWSDEMRQARESREILRRFSK